MFYSYRYQAITKMAATCVVVIDIINVEFYLNDTNEISPTIYIKNNVYRSCIFFKNMFCLMVRAR